MSIISLPPYIYIYDYVVSLGKTHIKRGTGNEINFTDDELPLQLYSCVGRVERCTTITHSTREVDWTAKGQNTKEKREKERKKKWKNNNNYLSSYILWSGGVAAWESLPPSTLKSEWRLSTIDDALKVFTPLRFAQVVTALSSESLRFIFLFLLEVLPTCLFEYFSYFRSPHRAV